jgi:hypothetical protein
MRREEYPLSEIPAQLQTIFISAEDSGFYRHGGIDFAAAARALFQNRKSGRIVSGASTITMQLARMVHPRIPGRKVTMRLKAAEAFAAVRIEAKLSKNKYLRCISIRSRSETALKASEALPVRSTERNRANSHPARCLRFPLFPDVLRCTVRFPDQPTVLTAP